VKKYYQYKKKHLPTIKHIPDNVWNEIKNILPKEKPRNTKGHTAVPFRKVLDGILFVCTENRMSMEYAAQRNMALVLPAIDGFSNGLGWEYFRNYGLDC
jgi:hypothetical protein